MSLENDTISPVCQLLQETAFIPGNDELNEKKNSKNISHEALKKKLTYIIQTKNESLSQKFSSEDKNFLIPFQEGIFPIDVHQLYSEYSTFILELGSGWGEFALEYAHTHPDSLYIAMDKKKYRIKKSIKEQIKKDIYNVRWLVCRFEWVFNGLFKATSIDSIIINFPDPWPKSRHQKHRFVSPRLIVELERIIKHGGNLEFATDNWMYMQEALPLFENSGTWENINGSNVILPQLANRPVSFFENLKRSEKENIYIIQMKKI